MAIEHERLADLYLIFFYNQYFFHKNMQYHVAILACICSL